MPVNNTRPDGYLSVHEYARKMERSIWTVYTWIRLGIVESVKVGEWRRYIPNDAMPQMKYQSRLPMHKYTEMINNMECVPADIHEVADITGINEWTIRNAIKDGRISPIRTGRHVQVPCPVKLLMNGGNFE